MSGLARRAWNETKQWRSAPREAAILGFVLGIGVAVSMLHHVSIVRTILLPLLAAAVAATLVPAAVFVVRVIPLPYRVIAERLDAMEQRLDRADRRIETDNLRELESLDE